MQKKDQNRKEINSHTSTYMQVQQTRESIVHPMSEYWLCHDRLGMKFVVTNKHGKV